MDKTPAIHLEANAGTLIALILKPFSWAVDAMCGIVAYTEPPLLRRKFQALWSTAGNSRKETHESKQQLLTQTENVDAQLASYNSTVRRMLKE